MPLLIFTHLSYSCGPLAWGTVVWRNKLVFHDMDKLTSVFIHLCPPLVTYCLRWYPKGGDFTAVCGHASGNYCSLSAYESLFTPLYLYSFWQLGYYIKTEHLDHKKFANDKDLMTSSRWMTQKEPHPVYRWFVARGYKGSGQLLLMGVQLLYTLVTLLPLPLFFNSFWLHTSFLFFVFMCILWGGASYYFEAFTEGYSKRLNRKREEVSARKLDSVFSSTAFFISFLVCLYCLLQVIL